MSYIVCGYDAPSLVDLTCLPLDIPLWQGMCLVVTGSWNRDCPWTCLLLCLSCFGIGGLHHCWSDHCPALSPVAPVLLPLRSSCSCCSLTSSAWQSCRTPIRSWTVTRPCLFCFSFQDSVISFVVLCVSFLDWLHLLKEGTATSICHVQLYPMS